MVNLTYEEKNSCQSGYEGLCTLSEKEKCLGVENCIDNFINKLESEIEVLTVEAELKAFDPSI